MSKPQYGNIIFANQQNEVLAMLYDDEIISKREYKIITEENFLYLEEKNGKIFAHLKN